MFPPPDVDGFVPHAQRINLRTGPLPRGTGTGATHAFAGKKGFTPSISWVTTSEISAESEFPSKGGGVEARWGGGRLGECGWLRALCGGGQDGCEGGQEGAMNLKGLHRTRTRSFSSTVDLSSRLRKRLLVGPYSRAMLWALWWS